jgi:hypothetical protein
VYIECINICGRSLRDFDGATFNMIQSSGACTLNIIIRDIYGRKGLIASNVSKNWIMLLNTVFFLGVAIILVGFAVETMGWKIHQQIVGLSGFIVGLVVGDFIGSQILHLDFIVWSVALQVVSSFIFTVLFFVYMRISIGITSGIVGALIVSGFTSSSTLTEWSLNYTVFQTNFNYPALILAFSVSGYAGYRFYRLGYIILSAGIGSILVAYGGLIAGFWTYSYLGIFLLLSLMLGMIVQLSEAGIIRERKIMAKELKFCPNCGKPIELNSTVCIKCGARILADDGYSD